MELSHQRYLENVVPVMSKLKWEIKKFNSETAGLYKDYKLKLLEVFRNHTLLPTMKQEMPSMVSMLIDKEAENFYRSLLECYGKVEKINDNGRQLIRMDTIEISKGLYELGITSSNWEDWFCKYLDLTSERSYKIVIEKVSKISTMY